MSARRVWIVAALLLGVAACGTQSRRPTIVPPTLAMPEIADAYVRLALAVDQLVPGYVDAYYGPPEWREDAKAHPKTAIEIRNEIAKLYGDLQKAQNPQADVPPEMFELRRRYIKNMLAAMDAELRIYRGWKPPFELQAAALYDIEPPEFTETDLDPALSAVERALPPGPGSVQERYNRYIDRFVVPRDKLEPVMRAAIDAARTQTLARLKLPAAERFELAFVTGKPWSAYNWYQGQYVSRIEVNTDLPVTISRAVTLASHEGYPGHHVYNVLMERRLVRGLGWSEYSVYPLYSPQSFIAEGSADFGMELAFPEPQRRALLTQLFGMAGLDPAEVPRYDTVMQEARGLARADMIAARRYLSGQTDRARTERWLGVYALYSPERAKQRVDFFDAYGAYVINYAYGAEIVRDWVQRTSGSQAPDAAQWEAFYQLLSTPRTPNRLLPAAASAPR